MKITYCDFCGAVIPEDEGDPVTLGDTESMPEARKDAIASVHKLDRATISTESDTERRLQAAGASDSCLSPTPTLAREAGHTA